VDNGRFEDLNELRSYHSIGNYYAYVTHICGFKAQKHEGKITGLAASGEPKYETLLREFVDEEGGTLVNKGGVVFREAIRALEDRLPKGWEREDLAASIQSLFEDVVRRVVGHWREESGQSSIALAGGVRTVLERARSLSKEGRHALACHLVEAARHAAPNDASVHEARTSIYRAASAPQTSSMARNILHHAALASEKGQRDLASTP